VRIEKLRRNYAIDVKFTQFPLHPDTPAEGKPRNVNGPSRVEALMAQEGLPYGERRFTYNSRLAQELAKWAESEGQGETIHDALFRAYFVERVNIGNVDVLLDVVSRLGLDHNRAREVLTNRAFSTAVDEDWRRCSELGVSAVPTYLAENLAVVGAEPYEQLEKLVTRAGASHRSPGEAN
jgi:predicted DsbA family dithiol-disulfide isomerase